jgi:hypothetical protein
MGAKLIIGVVFTQPDMLLPSRIHEQDFELKVGSALILLEYRVQQSPKTQLYLCPHILFVHI